METPRALVLAWTAAALLVPGIGWAGKESLCNGRAVSSGVVEPGVEMARIAATVKESAVQVLDHADILAMRGSYPFALHWTSHAVKLEDLNRAIRATTTAWCRLTAVAEMPGVEQFGTRLAEVSVQAERVIAMLQSNRLAHMGSEYQRSIQQIREHARQLNNHVAGVVQAVRSK